MKKKIITADEQTPAGNSKSNDKLTKEQLEKLNNKLERILGKDLRKLENIAKKKVGEKSYRENTQFIREFLEERVGKNNKASRIKTTNDFEELHYRLEKFNLIRKKAEQRFDSIISLTGVDKASLTQYDFVPGKNGITILKENNKYERSKEIFVNTIQNHFRANKIIISEISEGLPLDGELKEAKVANDITDVMDKMIDNVIDRYVNIVVLILGIAPPLNTKLKNEIESKISDLMKSENELNQRKATQSNSRKLKPEDISYQRNMKFIDEILTYSKTKYSVVSNFMKNDGKKLKASEKSVSNNLDSFLRNHKQEIIKKYDLTEVNFNKTFFPRRLSQK